MNPLLGFLVCIFHQKKITLPLPHTPLEKKDSLPLHKDSSCPYLLSVGSICYYQYYFKCCCNCHVVSVFFFYSVWMQFSFWWILVTAETHNKKFWQVVTAIAAYFTLFLEFVRSSEVLFRPVFSSCVMESENVFCLAPLSHPGAVNTTQPELSPPKTQSLLAWPRPLTKHRLSLSVESTNYAHFISFPQSSNPFPTKLFRPRRSILQMNSSLMRLFARCKKHPELLSCIQKLARPLNCICL